MRSIKVDHSINALLEKMNDLNNLFATVITFMTAWISVCMFMLEEEEEKEEAPNQNTENIFRALAIVRRM